VEQHLLYICTRLVVRQSRCLVVAIWFLHYPQVSHVVTWNDQRIADLLAGKPCAKVVGMSDQLPDEYDIRRDTSSLLDSNCEHR
jgi:hypothetical protein